MKTKSSQDFYLVLATVVVLFAISLICIYGMFYFKIAEIQQVAPAEKLRYMNLMNSAAIPFVAVLVLLLGVCIPKRLFPPKWLNIFAIVLIVLAGGTASWFGARTAVLLILSASLVLQIVVLVLAAGGSRLPQFEKSGYWVRVGSSLVHLGLILFVFDLLLYRYTFLHLFLFWITAVAFMAGMFFCFYAHNVVRLITLIKMRRESSSP